METAEELMLRQVVMFVDASGYEMQHLAVKEMSKIPGKENVKINLGWEAILWYYLKMQAFGFKHGLRDPECTCISQ